MSVNEEPNQSTLKQEVVDLASRSTVHGISNIVTSTSNYKRILWIIAFLVCFGYFVSQLVDIVTLYRSHPVSTKFKLDKNTEFPSISICNVKRYKPQKVDQIQNIAMGMTLQEFSYMNISTDEQLRQLVNSCKENKSTTDCEFLRYYDNATSHFEISMGYTNTLLSCDEGGFSKCNEFLHWISTVYGNCFTLSPNDTLANLYGLGGAVYMQINLENEYGFLTLDSGVRVEVHAKNTISMPYEDGITIQGGQQAFIGIKLTKINRLGKPYGECIRNDSFYGAKYTIKACMLLCWEELLLSRCGCTDIKTESLLFRKGEVRPPDCLSLFLDSSCKISTKSEFSKNPEQFCHCPAACEEDKYELQVSSSKAFDLQNTDSNTELSLLLTTVCANVYQKTYLLDCPLDTMISTDTNFAKLYFYLRDPVHERRQEEPLYEDSQILADIGGSLGLFIGTSILSLCEIIELIWTCCKASMRRRNKTNTNEEQD